MTGANRAAYFSVWAGLTFMLISLGGIAYAQSGANSSLTFCKQKYQTGPNAGKYINEGKQCYQDKQEGRCSKGDCDLIKKEVKPVGADGKPIDSATPSVNCTAGTAGCSNLSPPPSTDPPLSDGPLLDQPATIDPTKAFEPPTGGTDPFDAEPKDSIIDRLKNWWTAPADSNAELPAGRTPLNGGAPGTLQPKGEPLYFDPATQQYVYPSPQSYDTNPDGTFGGPNAGANDIKPGLPELTDEFIQQRLGDGPPIIDRAAFEAKVKAYQEAQERLQRYVDGKKIPSEERTLPPDPNGNSAGKYTQYLARTRAEEQELNRLIGGVNAAGKDYNKALADVEAASKYKPLALSSYAENYRSLYQQYDPGANATPQNAELNKYIAQSYMLNRANIARPILQQMANNSCNNADLTCDPKELKNLENVDEYIKQLKSGNITAPELKGLQAQYVELLGDPTKLAFAEGNRKLQEGAIAAIARGWNLLGTGPLNTLGGLGQIAAGALGTVTGGIFGTIEALTVHEFAGSPDLLYDRLLTGGVAKMNDVKFWGMLSEGAGNILAPGVIGGAGSLARAGFRATGDALLGTTLAGVGRGNFGFPGVVRELPPAQSLWSRLAGREDLGAYPGAYRQTEGFAAREGGTLAPAAREGAPQRRPTAELPRVASQAETREGGLRVFDSRTNIMRELKPLEEPPTSVRVGADGVGGATVPSGGIIGSLARSQTAKWVQGVGVGATMFGTLAREAAALPSVRALAEGAFQRAAQNALNVPRSALPSIGPGGIRTIGGQKVSSAFEARTVRNVPRSSPVAEARPALTGTPFFRGVL